MLLLEAQSRTTDADGDWLQVPNTDDFEEYAGTIAQDMRLTLASGLRVK